MCSCIWSNEAAKWCADADQSCEAHTTPTTSVVELGGYNLSGRMIYQHPKQDQECEESNDMNNKLNHSILASAHHVHRFMDTSP